ncbi:MAG: DUF4177 domain-containing protein [Pseudomonadota bacterium]
MAGWEYKVMPAPTKGLKGKGIKGPEGRFANALEMLMNEMGRDGWEFQRAETLPSVERSGLTGSTTEWRNMLVFRRAVRDVMDDFEPELLPAPAPVAIPDPAPDTAKDNDGEDAKFVPGPGATEMLPDNGVEGTSEVAGMTASLQKLASTRSEAEAKD